MISPELSMVQHNALVSAELSEATAAFLAQGGVIHDVPIKVHKPEPEPKPYGRKSTPPIKREVEQKAEPKRKARVPRIKVGPAMIERLKALAPNMSKVQAVIETGLSRHLLDRAAAEHHIEFKPHDRCANLKPAAIDPVADALNVVRIKEARDAGLARKQAARSLGISPTVVNRLIKEFEIDYPICPPGKRK